MSTYNFVKKQTSINFTVKNVSSQRKVISIFNARIDYGESKDLLNIPEITENDIKSSLVKGELASKIRAGDIIIVSSSIQLSQYDKQQRRFLNSASQSTDVISGLGNIGTIFWNPLGANADHKTWDDIMAIIEASDDPQTIIASSNVSYEIPPNSTPYNLKGAKLVCPLGDASSTFINIQDGATLLDLSGIEGAATIIGNSTDRDYPSLNYSNFISSSGVAVFLQQFGNYLRNDGTEPMIIVPDNNLFVLAQRFGGGIDLTSNVPVIQLGNNCTFILGNIGSSSRVPTNSIVGPATVNMIIQQDGSFDSNILNNLPGFLGAFINAPYGADGGSGPSSFRPLPILYPYLNIGTKYFDTDLTPPKPIWWDGTQWVDATGTGPL